MSFIDKFLVPFQKGLRQSVSSFIRLETKENDTTLVSADGSLISYVKVEGSRQIIGQEEYRKIVDSSNTKIGARFDRLGHAMQVYFARDPARIHQTLVNKVRPGKTTAHNIGLDLDDLFQEKITHLERFLTHEEQYFVLWTRPIALSKSELKREAEKAKSDGKKWVNAGFAQYPHGVMDPLRTRHKSFIAAMMTAFEEMSIECSLMEVHDALAAVRNNMFPDKANEKWRACLPGDPIPPRAPQSAVDMSDILWPSLPNQITAAEAKVLGKSVVRIGNLLWAGGDMTLGPMDSLPFPILLNRMVEADIPFRVSFLIEGGGASAVAFRAFMATLMGPTNASNKPIKYSLESLQALGRQEPVVRVRISFATWCEVSEKEKILDRLSIMLQAFESWGYCQVSDHSGDPLDCVMSSAMGIHCGGTAPSGIAPMIEITKLLPWQRPSSPFEEGSMLFRSPDGKIWPYQTGTNLTTTWFDLIFAQPGGGKSVLLNTLNFGTCLTPGLSKLPFVSVIDIGPSSSGLISLIKEALPLNRQYEANYFRLQMAHQYAINPFDTQLGCRYPLSDERSFLVEILTLLTTPPGYDKPYDGMQQLCGLVVDEMFRWRDDSAANAEARPYLPRLEMEVDAAIQKHNIHLPSEPLWWDIVDKLHELDLTNLANLAQRHAVPTLNDAITASRRPQIRSLLEQTSVGVSAESVLGAFERMITSAIREYPIISSVTQFEIADTRLCSLDLMDVAPQGDDAADRQTSIMYMLARHALVRAWWVSADSIASIPEKYQPYHQARLQDVGETPKRLNFDEFHRTSKSASVRAQIIRDVREGRKRGVQIVLTSQLIDDFDKDMVDLATGIWILGTAISDKAVQNVVDRFGLSNTARDIMRYKLTGPKAIGGPALVVIGSTSGRYEQHIYNTLGPIELWAFSTSSEDVAIRNRLYALLGASRARQMLAMKFPGGSARNEIRRRVLASSESGDSKSSMISAVIEQIVDELVEESRKSQAAEDSKRVPLKV
ncbi:MAG: type IV secretion protein IcmB [Alphaproteobacteria bacterium]|nr:type IV secretion protein IcmB [Alphaproteobacteria bacterium]